MENKRVLSCKDKVRIDEEKFKMLARKRGFTLCELSRKIYKGKSFVSQIFTRYDGWVKRMYFNGLCYVLQCEEEDILYEDKVEEPKQEPIEEIDDIKVLELTSKELSELIYKSVYSAVHGKTNN
jgi:DNA-binding Xre family transcriptional regulator